MEFNLTEIRSRITKTLTATAENYSLTANAVIEDGKIVSMSGNVIAPEDTMGVNDIRFDVHRANGELRVNYRNIATDEREVIDCISSLVDAVVAKYEE